jgi:hypothetical protein
MTCQRAESSGEINRINEKSACILQALVLYYHGDFVEMPGELCPDGRGFPPTVPIYLVYGYMQAKKGELP